MVLHASKGENPPEINDQQLGEIKKLSMAFNDVNLAFENVRNNNNLEKILSLNQKNITFCFDIGHANAFGSFNLLSKYKNKMSCAHLHNNFGEDSHNLLSEGEIDYLPIIEEIKKIKIIAYLEVFPPMGLCLSDKEFESFVTQAYNDIHKGEIY